MATLIDPLCVQDTFVEKLALVQPLSGDCFRFVFTVREQCDGSEADDMIVEKLVAHYSTAIPAVLYAAREMSVRWDRAEIKRLLMN